MDWYYLLLIIVGSISALLLILYPFILSLILVLIHMVRTKKSKWGRVCSSLKNQEQVTMWNKGFNYIEPYKNLIEEVSINSDNLKLYGEFFNQNSDTCVILLGGRCESLCYSYYYALPYLKANYNVLVIDPRAHGKSEGKVNTVGFKEAIDLANWVKFLQNEKNIKHVIIHGTCIGAATGIIMLGKYQDIKVDAIIADSLYKTYYETFDLHMQALNKNNKFILNLTFAIYKLISHVDSKNYGPITYIDKVNVPILFLCGKEDSFVSQASFEELFTSCESKARAIFYFDKGNHSHLRINQEEAYDETIMSFLKINKL